MPELLGCLAAVISIAVTIWICYYVYACSRSLDQVVFNTRLICEKVDKNRKHISERLDKMVAKLDAFKRPPPDREQHTP